MGRAAPCKTGILYGHQLFYPLLHFPSSSLQKASKSQKMAQILGPLLHKWETWGSWLSPGPAMIFMAIWRMHMEDFFVDCFLCIIVAFRKIR